VPTLREWVIEIAVMLAIGVVLAALGPFGSFTLGTFADRLLYWVPAALLGYIIIRPTILVALVIAKRLTLPEVPTAGAGILVAAAPGSYAIAYLGGYRPGAGSEFQELFQLYLHVALIGILVMFVFILIERRAVSHSAREHFHIPPSAAPLLAEPEADIPFFRRLPVAWHNKLIAIEMEDHYVRAHGPGTSVLILLRMRDAEDELSGYDGLRVHRSWWVSRSAVKEVLRVGRNVTLHLDGGLEAPVARDRIVVLKDAGWLV
jgi:hypothetical protein